MALWLIVSIISIEIGYTGTPEWELWGNKQFIQYDKENHCWMNHNPGLETWRHYGDRKLTEPEKIPEKRTIKFVLKPVFWRKEQTPLFLAGVLIKSNRRIILINPEQSINESGGDNTEHRIWPHLGLLTVGTVAKQEGWKVRLHDELIEGYVDLEKIIKPGDVVGFSLVITGIERGIELAHQAKKLGAGYVIAGNDSAIFRAEQILRLPGQPIDAVFLSNNLTPIRRFFRELGRTGKINLPGVATVPVINNPIRKKMFEEIKKNGTEEIFLVPDLKLYPENYWQKVWNNYRKVFGHKHNRPDEVKNTLGLLAQGCPRAAIGQMCSYCSIYGANQIRTPNCRYLEDLMKTFDNFGINYLFNVTDSAYEMRALNKKLRLLKVNFPQGMTIYGRAWGLANYPELLADWLSLTGGRLVVNSGMDSGDENILSKGINKNAEHTSPLADNILAIKNIKKSGAHFHYSLIFGSPGETRESCQKTMEFFEWSRSELGGQLDQCESDLFWLNHGSPASRIFTNYEYAGQLAGLANKNITREDWVNDFYRHRNSLVVPWTCQEAWYKYFTSISVAEAREYQAKIANIMAGHAGAVKGRKYAFKKL